MQKTDKLISVNDLLEKVQYRIDTPGIIGSTVRDMVATTRRIIEEAPAVDAVEVIRCKTCKHWTHTALGVGDCTNRRFAIPNFCSPSMPADGYCCLGERRVSGGS